MKHVIFILSGLLFMVGCSSNWQTYQVPSNGTIDIPSSDYNTERAYIKNKGKNAIEVSVVDEDTGEKTSGFGLEKRGKADVIVPRNKVVKVNNPTSESTTVSIKMKTEVAQAVSSTAKYIKFTLVNDSNASIPLLIPSVMNPNLSPNSRSGVSLKVGQKILFRSKGKKHILLVVDDAIQNGDEIEVSALLEQRKATLGLRS